MRIRPVYDQNRDVHEENAFHDIISWDIQVLAPLNLQDLEAVFAAF